MSRDRPAGSIAVIGTRGLPALYGGFETCAEKTSRFWAAWGHDVVVYCWGVPRGERRKYHNGVRLVHVPSYRHAGLGTPTAALCAVIHMLLFERSVRSVHLYNGVNGVLVALIRLSGARILWSVDGLEWKRDKWGPVQRTAHRLGEWSGTHSHATVVADNEAVAAYYREHHGIEPAVIAYGADVPQRDPDAPTTLLDSLGLTTDGYYIFVGRLVPEKNVPGLVAAYRRLRTDKPLVIVGDTGESLYRDELLANDCEMVRFVGFRYGSDYEQLLTNAYMYVSASDVEGTSPSLLAAMGAGICSLVQGIPENRATTMGSIALYEEGNLDALVDRWQELTDDPREAEKLALQGADHVRQNYQWDRIASQYLEAWGLETGSVVETDTLVVQ